MATQILVIFIIRTHGRPWKDLPQPVLVVWSLVALAVAMVLPFTPAGRWFGLEAPPLGMLGAVGFLVALYLVCAELLKRIAVAPSAAMVTPLARETLRYSVRSGRINEAMHEKMQR
jgi:Mg2+-importing ATPase